MWCTPEQLVAAGLDASSTLMVNEGHNGFSRCVRTRIIGVRMIRAAHELGCRALAMEALPNFGLGPTEHTTRPAPSGRGYLTQPEMIYLIDTAVGLGWTLIGYEADFSVAPTRVRADTLSLHATNWREAQQARSLAAAVERLDGAPLVVWVGNGHHTKRVVQEWTPMGYLLTSEHGVTPYCIDQLASVALDPSHQPTVEVTADLARTLDALGGTAGFTAVQPPAGMTVMSGYDAHILSTDNAMVGEPPGPRSPGRP